MTPKEIQDFKYEGELSDGCYYEHATDESVSDGYVGGNGRAGETHCLSFITQPQIDCYIEPRIGCDFAEHIPKNPDYFKSPVPDDEFQTFLEYVASIHPTAKRNIENEPPTTDRLRLRIGTGHGYLNYFIMTQWRNLWCRPKAVLLSNYMFREGYEWPEIMAVIGLFDVLGAFENSGWSFSLPLQEDEVYGRGVLTIMENIEVEMPECTPYQFNNDLAVHSKHYEDDRKSLINYAKQYEITHISDLETRKHSIDQFLKEIR